MVHQRVSSVLDDVGLAIALAPDRTVLKLRHAFSGELTGFLVCLSDQEDSRSLAWSFLLLVEVV
jgi:hypothetical protein